METKLIKSLPWLALAGLVVLVVSFSFSSNQRDAMLIDTGETAQSAVQALAKIKSVHPYNVRETDFLDRVEALLDEPNIATVWLFDAEGNAVLSAGSTAQRKMEGSVENLAPMDTKRMLESLPNDSVTSEQRQMLLTAATIRSEGEHNDIYRHKVTVITNSTGEKVGMVGLAYDVSPQINGQPDALYQVSLTLFFLGLAVYWLSLPAWVYLDARLRGERAVVWAVFILIGNLVALAAYLLVRQPGLRMDKG